MPFNYRNVLQRPLSFAEHDENLQTVEQLHDAAVQASEVAIAHAGIYATTAAGLAATANGEYFSVPSATANAYLDLYRNNAGVAELVKTLNAIDPSALDLKLNIDYSTLADSAALAGADLFPVRQGSATKKGTIQKVLDWIRTQAITWTQTQVSTTLNAARLVAGNYGAIVRHDGADVFVLFTASGDQYGNFNSLRPLRINDATGDVFLGNGAFSAKHGGNVEHLNFTKLGESSPALKFKKLSGTTAATEGGSVTVAHGVTWTKIVSFEPVVQVTSYGGVPPDHTRVAGYQYHAYYDGTTIVVTNHATNSENILSKPFTVLIGYEE